MNNNCDKSYGRFLELLIYLTRYFIGRQTLCMRFRYRRWRLWRGAWQSLDEDLRDGTHSALIDVLIQQEGQDPLVINVESHWPMSFLRHEIQLMCIDAPKDFYFKLDGRKIGSRNEATKTCSLCIEPHVLEIITPRL